jgi:hypothetical protein
MTPIVTTDNSPVTVDSITTATAAVLGRATRARRVLNDPDFPETLDDVDRLWRAHPDPLNALWSRLGVASAFVDDFEVTLHMAQDSHHRGLAYVDKLDQQTSVPVDDVKALDARDRVQSEERRLREALPALARAIDAARDPLRLLIDLVARAVEIALHFERDVKHRRILYVVEHARKELAAIRATADEHYDLRTRWEARLGRAFILRDLSSPTVAP